MSLSVSNTPLLNSALNSPTTQAKKKSNANPEDIDFSGFMKILMTKVTHQSPLAGDGEPLDIMSEITQMTVAKNSMQQVEHSKKILEELQNIKQLLSLGEKNRDLETMKIQMNGIEKQLSQNTEPLNRALEGIQLADKLIKSVF